MPSLAGTEKPWKPRHDPDDRHQKIRQRGGLMNWGGYDEYQLDIARKTVFMVLYMFHIFPPHGWDHYVKKICCSSGHWVSDERSSVSGKILGLTWYGMPGRTNLMSELCCQNVGEPFRTWKDVEFRGCATGFLAMPALLTHTLRCWLFALLWILLWILLYWYSVSGTLVLVCHDFLWTLEFGNHDPAHTSAP